MQRQSAGLLSTLPAASAEPLRRPKLLASGIRKSFGPLEILKGVSLAAYEHDVIALLGSSGSGKSTFLRCINYLESPTGGRVAVDGEEIAVTVNTDGSQRPADARQIQRLRTRLAMVFQGFNLWSHMTVLENVIEAPVFVLNVPRKEATERAMELLTRMGVADRRHFYPGQLSGGQQQRVAIARALAVDPAVMLFDEPTSALDPELVAEVLTTMRQLADDGRTMIIVTHELGFAREVSNRTVFLHDGRIEEEGETAQVMSNPSSEIFRRFLSRARLEADCRSTGTR